MSTAQQNRKHLGYNREDMMKNPYQTTGLTVKPEVVGARIFQGEKLLASPPAERVQLGESFGLDSLKRADYAQVAGFFGSKSRYDQTLVRRAGWKVLQSLSAYVIPNDVRHEVFSLVLHWLSHWWGDQAQHVTCPHTILPSVKSVLAAIRPENRQVVAILYAHMLHETSQPVTDEQAALLALDAPRLEGITPVVEEEAVIEDAELPEEAGQELVPLVVPATNGNGHAAHNAPFVISPEFQEELLGRLLEVARRMRKAEEAAQESEGRDDTVERGIARIETTIQQRVDAALKEGFERRMAGFERFMENVLGSHMRGIVAMMREANAADQETIARLTRENAEYEVFVQEQEQQIRDLRLLVTSKEQSLANVRSAMALAFEAAAPEDKEP